MQTVRVSATCAGMTNAVYASGDQMGTEMTLTGMARLAGMGGTIISLTVTDDILLMGAHDLYIFNAATTPVADNAANSWSDADMQKLIGVISVPGVVTSALNGQATVNNIGMGFVTSATANLFMDIVARTANAAMSAATAVRYNFTVFQD